MVMVLMGFAAVAPPANAQARTGVRAGVSANPDQFYFGGHVETPPVVDRLRFRPKVEVGVGDNATLSGFNVLFGLQSSKGAFFEAKIGTFDSPDLKFGVGYTFK